MTVQNVLPRGALPVFARLYGCSEEDFSTTSDQLTAAWIVQEDENVFGAIGLRPSPAHGAETIGGAFTGKQQHEAALALIRAALAAQPKLYAYAEAHLLPRESLEAAGLHQISAYTRMSGLLPTLPPEIPHGFKIVSLTEVEETQDRLLAQQTYSDRIGHTHVPVEVMEPNFGGSDDTLSQLAYDAAGAPVGICRVTLSGKQASLGTPGVHPTGLRRALLLAACQAARMAGAKQLVLEAWGDTETERLEDEALGFRLEESTPIYASA
jgi:hypothetical protein